jgi:hypothetical protein
VTTKAATKNLQQRPRRGAIQEAAKAEDEADKIIVIKETWAQMERWLSSTRQLDQGRERQSVRHNKCIVGWATAAWFLRSRRKVFIHSLFYDCTWHRFKSFSPAPGLSLRNIAIAQVIRTEDSRSGIGCVMGSLEKSHNPLKQKEDRPRSSFHAWL